MAFDLNVVTLIGNLTRDPELSYSNSGMPICSFSIANNTGKEDDQVSFFDVVCFQKQAENVSLYCKRGSKVVIVGKLQQRRWEDQNGQKRYKVEIVANTVGFLSTKKNQDNQYDS